MTDAPDEVLDLLDALILAGGGDVDPALYGAAPDEHTGNVRPERDAFEIALAHAALERDLPLLGVCRGMEILNVALGGDLIQHLDTAETHLHTPGQFIDHDVVLEPGSLAARAAGGRADLGALAPPPGAGAPGGGARGVGARRRRRR